MKPIVNRKNPEAFKIVEKYEGFFNYLYPLLINLGGQHKVLRDHTIKTMIAQIGLFNDASKSNQISRLYLADSGIATIRDLLRILSHQKYKLISLKQYGHATKILAEVGAMTGSWIIKKQKGKGNNG